MYTTFIYDGTFNGLISAVYEAFYSKLPVTEVRIIENCSAEQRSTLFDREIIVETSEDNANKVLSALIKKISYDVYYDIYMVFLSFYPDKGDVIFKYIKLCFAMGRKIFIHISHPDISRVKKICRRVSFESHKLLGFVRFQQINSGIYFSRITPENNQLELIAPHFSERMYYENWIIYDSNRKLACVHNARKAKEGQNDFGDNLKKDFYITDDIPDDILNNNMDSHNTQAESKYRGLWKSFFDTLGIAERYNPKCQRTLMPKRYWENMVEVKDKLN